MPLLNMPVLARSDDRTQIVREPERIAKLIDVATRRAPVAGAMAAPFDFFVDWRIRQVEGNLWVKRTLPVGHVLPMSKGELERAIAADPVIRRCRQLAHAQHRGVSIAMFDDAMDWGRSTGKDILMVSLPADGSMRLTPVTLDELKAAIQVKSGGPFRIGDKGLVYSTTAIEAHLSRTTAPWPGDADLVVFDAHDHEPRCVIEMKKHTARSRLPFDRQRVENYAHPGGPDHRKYDRLSLLAEQISASGPVPLFTLYYSTERGDDRLRLERVTRAAGGFTGRAVATIDQRYKLPTQVLEHLYAATTQDARDHPPAVPRQSIVPVPVATATPQRPVKQSARHGDQR